jgi:hypothetical protein
MRVYSRDDIPRSLLEIFHEQAQPQLFYSVANSLTLLVFSEFPIKNKEKLRKCKNKIKNERLLITILV